MQDRAFDFATGGLHGFRRIVLQGMAEGVIGSDEEPAVAAMLNYRAAGHATGRIGVINVMNGIGVAIFVGESSAAGIVDHEEPVFLVGNFAHRDGHAGVGHVHDQVNLLGVKPFARLAGADVGFVLVVG